MKNIFKEILNSNNFTNWLKNSKNIERIIKGGRGKNQREIILRDIVFKELEKNIKDRFEKEKNKHDIREKNTKTTIEFGHNGLWQPTKYHINKPISDFFKRAQECNKFYSVHFITDIIELADTHKSYVGKSYLKKINYYIENRKFAEDKLDEIKSDFKKLDSEPVFYNIKNLTSGGSSINLYIIIIGPIEKSNWKNIQKNFDGELNIVKKNIENLF